MLMDKRTQSIPITGQQYSRKDRPLRLSQDCGTVRIDSGSPRSTQRRASISKLHPDGFTVAKPTQFQLTNQGAVSGNEESGSKQVHRTLVHNASTESLYDEHQKRDNNMTMVRVILRKRNVNNKNSKSNISLSKSI